MSLSRSFIKFVCPVPSITYYGIHGLAQQSNTFPPSFFPIVSHTYIIAEARGNGSLDKRQTSLPTWVWKGHFSNLSLYILIQWPGEIFFFFFKKSFTSLSYDKHEAFKTPEHAWFMHQHLSNFILIIPFDSLIWKNKSHSSLRF